MFLATIATWFGLRQRQRQGLTSPTRRPFSAFAGDRGVCSFSRMTHVPELGAGSRIPSATRLPVCPHAARDEPCTFLLHGGMAPTRPRRTVCSVSFSSPVSSAVLPVTRCNSLVTGYEPKQLPETGPMRSATTRGSCSRTRTRRGVRRAEQAGTEVAALLGSAGTQVGVRGVGGVLCRGARAPFGYAREVYDGGEHRLVFVTRLAAPS